MKYLNEFYWSLKCCSRTIITICINYFLTNLFSSWMLSFQTFGFYSDLMKVGLQPFLRTDFGVYGTTSYLSNSKDLHSLLFFSMQATETRSHFSTCALLRRKTILFHTATYSSSSFHFSSFFICSLVAFRSSPRIWCALKRVASVLFNYQ